MPVIIRPDPAPVYAPANARVNCRQGIVSNMHRHLLRYRYWKQTGSSCTGTINTNTVTKVWIKPGSAPVPTIILIGVTDTDIGSY